MILPSKHLSQDRALLTIGARILQSLRQPKTVSALWEAIAHTQDRKMGAPPLRFDAFILALDLLFLMNAIDIKNGLVVNVNSFPSSTPSNANPTRTR